jgi:hypothetical protein
MGGSDNTAPEASYQNQCIDDESLYTVPNLCAEKQAAPYPQFIGGRTNIPIGSAIPPSTVVTAFCEKLGGTYAPSISDPTDRARN